MHSSSTKLPVAIVPVAPERCAAGADVARDRHSAPRLVQTEASLEDPETLAERELEAYFARRRAAAPRDAEDEMVEATLASISAYHRGVLTLHHDARTWPEGVVAALSPYASIGVRLDCADHPGAGSTPALEQVAAQRIAALFAAEGDKSQRLTLLFSRAMTHHMRAIRGYAKALASRLVEKP
jgi:hypothetical protein